MKNKSKLLTERQNPPNGVTERYQCSRCKEWVEDKDSDVYHFKSVHKPHTLLSIQICLKCRDEIFAFIEKNVSHQVDTANFQMVCPHCGEKLTEEGFCLSGCR